MATKTFRVAGSKEDLTLDSSSFADLDTLKQTLGSELGVVRPEGLSFHRDDGSTLESTSDVAGAEDQIIVKIDGHPVRDVPGPQALPVVGNYFEVYPDHLGNNQRLFEKYGPIFQASNYNNVNYQTNDPDIAQIVFTESEFFSKEITPSHPLYPLKNSFAGVFLADTSDPSWKLVHKFLPPALGPKAVRHYAPTMNGCIDEAWPVFDELESRNEAWNVYQYMLKLSSGTVGKIVLGKDYGHFKSVDAPLHLIVVTMAENLALNKKITTRGSWYAHLPFGDPVRFKHLQEVLKNEIIDSMKTAKANGTEDLPLQDAALKAANVIDYLSRAVDNNGEKLPIENVVPATVVASGAGFTTTSSLLSWCIYGFVTYPGVQARLLQELVNQDITDATNITAEQIDNLSELGKYIKEMQRRHNPSYQPGRTAQKDLILPGGYRVPKGTVVIPAIHHIHNNPAVWDAPERFDPDRWDTENVQHRHKASYVPFAMGQRMCVGFNFALLEVKIFVAKLVWRFHWEKEGDIETEYDPFFQLIRPVNLYVKTEKRTTWPSKSEETSSS